MNKKQLEQTLVLIKPDALKNSVTGFILSQLSEFHTGSRFAALKVVNVNRILAEEHYAEHKGKAFYEPILDYICGKAHYSDENKWKRRVIAIVYMGPNALKTIRMIAGPTNPHQAREEAPGCLRSLGTLAPLKDSDGEVLDHRMDNLIHTSASPQEAEKEIKLWFVPHDIPPLMRAYPTEICDKHYYLKNGKLSENYEPGSTFIVASGDVVWKTDLDILKNCEKSGAINGDLNKVIAKYLINKNE